MTNFSSKIFGSALSSLHAQQARIANLSNNIANVNTPGYARRTVNLQTRASSGADALAVGSGVDIAGVTRHVNEFMEGILRDSTGDYHKASMESGFIDRLESMFSLNGSSITIGSALNNFFGAADDLSVDPSSIELRQNFIQRANDLTGAIKNTFDGIADLQAEADTRLSVEISSINSLTTQIAQLNNLIAGRESEGNVAADERDQRDSLINKLSEKMSFEQLELPDGSVNLTLPSGFALVAGSNANQLEVTQAPTFTTGGAQMLNGSQPSYVVFNYGTTASPEHVDFTAEIANGGGSLSGLINIRGVFDTTDTNALQVSGALVDVASRIDALTQSLLVDLNTTYLGPDRDGGTLGHQPSSGDLDGNNPAVYGLFQATGVTDANADGLPDATDLTASGLQTFSSALSVTISDPRDVAAARDSSSGPPAAAVYQDGDGRNMIAIAGLQTTDATLVGGNYSETVTYDESYNNLVATVGNYRSRVEVDVKVSEANMITAQNNRDEIAAVSLDEEFSQLIQFQRVFQASARMINVADQLLEQMVTLI